MPPPVNNQDYLRRILEELESGSQLSQRALALRLDIALGHANQLLRKLIAQGWVEATPGPGRRLIYSVTPAGADARVGMSRELLGRAVASFGPARDRVRDCLKALKALSANGNGGSAVATRPSVVLYGTTDVAQIAYACAYDAGVQLVGFVDDAPRESFLGLPVCPWTELTSVALGGRQFDWLLVTSLSDHDGIRLRLQEIGFPLERVSWI